MYWQKYVMHVHDFVLGFICVTAISEIVYSRHVQPTRDGIAVYDYRVCRGRPSQSSPL